MSKTKKQLLTIFGLLPLTVFASGNYIIPTIFIDFFDGLIILAVIVLLRIKWTGKVLLTATYFLTMLFIFWSFDGVSSPDNMIPYNLISGLLPPTVVFTTYWTMKDKFKKLRQ